ncbi:XapX domain-containing protein [Constrictibacter sp. MBR-5]|jgi:XapX domain-containing protein|uniref:DUF1427 family protein n=1 Tax=Constrictibacter sp. MBR-5 TaxID=3156467 RepID=UPI003395165F
MTAALVGIVLGLAIGGGCRWFDVPLPAPPKLVGALLVVAMTLGFRGTDLALDRWTAPTLRVEAMR